MNAYFRYSIYFIYNVGISESLWKMETKNVTQFWVGSLEI